jgi:hypothetical protein
MLHSTSQSKSLFRQGENETFTDVLHFFLIASHAGDITAAYSIVICVVLHRTLGISPQHGRLRHVGCWSTAWSSGKI